MLTSRFLVLVLKALLALLFAGLVVAETLSVPGQFSHFAEDAPGLAPLRFPLLAFTIAEIVALQIVLVCVWRLLTLVGHDRIFSAEAFRWVDVVVGTMAVAWVLMAAAFATVVGVVFLTPELRDPGTPILLTGIGLVTTVVVLLMVVMRALLHQAAALRTDLEAVI